MTAATPSPWSMREYAGVRCSTVRYGAKPLTPDVPKGQFGADSQKYYYGISWSVS